MINFVLLDIYDGFVEPVKYILTELHLPKLLPFASWLAIVLYGLTFGLYRVCVKSVTLFLKKKRTIKTSIDLHPKFQPDEIEDYCKNYIKPRYQLGINHF